MVHHSGHFRGRNLRVDVQRGSNVAVSELGLHLGRVCFFLAMRGEASPEQMLLNRLPPSPPLLISFRPLSALGLPLISQLLLL